MAKLYVFGIGGTGSRVLKALTMLFASGIKLGNNFDTVVPIIIDPDVANGDLNRTKNILKSYCEIREKINEPNDFYQQKIQSVSDVLNNGSVNTNPFELQIKGTSDSTFQQYLDFATMSSIQSDATKADQEFVKLLYSNENLDANLNIGFKGNPNMGSVVLNQIINSPDFTNFCQSFQTGDAIFIINSIFGGTGAAGFPLLLKNLRGNTNIPNAAYINPSIIGDITYLPYFTLAKPNDGYKTVNPNTFDEKAKIALEYYNRTIIDQNQINTIYFIGNKGNTNAETYAEGHSAQKNNAHFLEMAGALAIIDFCKNITLINHNTIVKEFGIENDKTNSITFEDLNSADTELIACPLIKFKIYTEYLSKGLDKSLDVSRWTKSNIKLVSNTKQSLLDNNFFRSQEFGLIKFFNEHFTQWCNEMEINQPSFSPFNSIGADNIFEIRKNKKPKGSKSCRDIDSENCRITDNIEFRKNSTTMLIKMFSKSIEKIAKKKEII